MMLNPPDLKAGRQGGVREGDRARTVGAVNGVLAPAEGVSAAAPGAPRGMTEGRTPSKTPRDENGRACTSGSARVRSRAVYDGGSALSSKLRPWPASLHKTRAPPPSLKDTSQSSRVGSLT